MKNVHFTSVRRALALCVLCLGSKRHVRISALDAFTDTGFIWLLLLFIMFVFLLVRVGLKKLKDEI